MDNLIEEKNNKQIAIWLLIGVGMIVIQVLLGGITRLTESGLSITEWKPITGALPPLNNTAWQVEFEKYRTTDQFKYVHGSFSLSDFKFIFFWEWAHRLWARLMGVVFLVGFVYFLIRRKFNPGMIMPMIILFILGALQGAIGWLMVKSGLVPEKYFVGHVELTTHFIAALILLSYTLWFALSLLPGIKEKIYHSKLKNSIFLILIMLFFQLIYGGFMAGLHAAVTAQTWPDINGQFIPSSINELSPWIRNLVDNKLAVQFIHRALAYLLLIFVLLFYFRSAKFNGNKFFTRLRNAALLLIVLQVLLGIFTVLNAANDHYFVMLGVSHQFTAMLLVMCLVSLRYIVRGNKLIS
ncbi:MAG: COX15/CtaA family protein [Ferruginibacter sp.]